LAKARKIDAPSNPELKTPHQKIAGIIHDQRKTTWKKHSAPHPLPGFQFSIGAGSKKSFSLSHPVIHTHFP